MDSDYKYPIRNLERQKNTTRGGSNKEKNFTMNSDYKYSFTTLGSQKNTTRGGSKEKNILEQFTRNTQSPSHNITFPWILEKIDEFLSVVPLYTTNNGNTRNNT